MHSIIEMKFGSHVYGTSTPESDEDFKGVFIPSASDIILGRAQEVISTSTKQVITEKNSSGDVDIEKFSLKKFVKLLAEGQTVPLTMVFVPKEFYTTEPRGAWKELLNMKDQFIHKNVASFAGYCRQQANKYGIKGSRVAASRAARDVFLKAIDTYGSQARVRDIIPSLMHELAHEHISVVDMDNHGTPQRFLEVCGRKIAFGVTLKEGLGVASRIFDEYGLRALQTENNQNVDWKAVMHATRVSGEAIELLTTKHITYPRPDAAHLLQIRTGQLPYKQVAENLEELLKNLEEIAAKSDLPAEANKEALDAYVLDNYLDEIIFEYKLG